MIDLGKLSKLRGWLDVALKVMEKNGLPTDARLKGVTPTPSGVVLHMEDDTHWKVSVNITKIDGNPTREDYSS